MGDPTLYDNLASVTVQLDTVLRQMQSTDGTLGRLMRDDTLYTHMVNMVVAGDSLMRMLSSGQGLAGRLLSDATLYDRLNKLTTDLSAILDDVRKDPRRYLKGMICVLNCK